jgi:hypothetical protein
VQHPQDINDVTTDAVSRDVRRSVDDQLARPLPAATPSDLRELQQAGDGRKDTLNLTIGGAGIILSDVGPRRDQVVHR